MADQLFLQTAWDNNATCSLSFLVTGTGSGFELMQNGWQPARAPDPYTPVVETLKLTVKTSGPDNLALQVRNLNRYFELARQFDHDETLEKPVYLYGQLGAESGSRRSLVLDGSYQFDVDPYSATPRQTNQHFLTVAIRRAPAWEDPDGWASVLADSASSLGGMTSSASNFGDMPARARLEIGGTSPLTTVWLGFRSVRKHGYGFSGYQPLWEAESGSAQTDTSASSDGTASGSSRLLCTFATTASLVERVFVQCTNVSGSPTNNAGRFLALGRMKLSSGSDTVRVKLRSGFRVTNSTPIYKTGDYVAVTSTSWLLYELGIIKFPPIYGTVTEFDISTEDMVSNATLSLMAERASGTTSSLDIDCFVLIPIDEGFVKIASGGMTLVRRTLIATNIKDRVFAALLAGRVYGKSADYVAHNLYWPVGEYRIVCASQETTQSVATDTLAVYTYIIPRYYTLIGNLS